jgi:hypothetical protein
MARTRDFAEVIRARMAADPAFAEEVEAAIEEMADVFRKDPKFWSGPTAKTRRCAGFFSPDGPRSGDSVPES